MPFTFYHGFQAMPKKTIRDIQVAGKRVLVRVDFNVPLDEKLQITDDTRIQASLPTVQYLLQQGAAVVLMSTWGAPRASRWRACLCGRWPPGWANCSDSRSPWRRTVSGKRWKN